MKKFKYISFFQKIIFATIIVCGNTHSLRAQDIHFSQFMSSPMNLNPAQTGGFDGIIRIVGNGRRQWNSITIPYQTFGLAVDGKFLNMKNVAGGVAVYNDRTGDSRLNTFIANGSLAYTIPFDRKGKQGITVGVISGITQRSINYSELKYDNQYGNTGYDPNMASNEEFGRSSRANLNIDMGLQWFKNTTDRKKISTGVALYNINTPNQSFSEGAPSLLDRRLNLHASLQRQISKRVDLLPAVLWSHQGAYNAILVGSAVKYIMNLNPNHYRAFYIGAWTRGGDAGWLSAGMDYGDLYTCVSYDINYSRLTPASNYRGGIEISAIYIIKNLMPRRKKYLSCPDFL